MLRSDIKPNVRTYTALITGGFLWLARGGSCLVCCVGTSPQHGSAAAAACRQLAAAPNCSLTAMPHPRLCPSAALGNARQWDRALDIVRRMLRHGFGGGLEPNAYTYSGEQAGCLAALLPCCLLI